MTGALHRRPGAIAGLSDPGDVFGVGERDLDGSVNSRTQSRTEPG
jgi:hypothetical protein